jgi:hypothetical protein
MTTPRLTASQTTALDALRAADGQPVTPTVTTHGIRRSTLNSLVALGLATHDGREWKYYLAAPAPAAAEPQTAPDAQPVTFNFYRAGLDLWGNDLSRDRKYTNEGRASEQGYEPCMRCGRGIKPGGGFEVTVVDGGGALQRTDVEADPDDAGFMGTFVIGSDCAKKVPAAFKSQYMVNPHQQ